MPQAEFACDPALEAYRGHAPWIIAPPLRPSPYGAACSGAVQCRRRRALHPRCAAQSEETAGVRMQQFLAHSCRQVRVRADQASHLLLPEREGIVGAEHDAILAHDLDEEA